MSEDFIYKNGSLKRMAGLQVQAWFKPYGQTSGRLHYLDWLRVLAILGVFAYHASRPFTHQEWLIMNDDRSALVSLFFLVFLGSWGMPLFFLIAGASSSFALQRRSGRHFARERFTRMAIPFIIGCLLLSPVQFYLEWQHKGWYTGSFLGFIPVLAQDRWQQLSERLSPRLFEAFGSHLWFLGFLFSFSLLALPLFLWLKEPSGTRVLGRLGDLCDRRGGILIFVVPAVLARCLLQPHYPAYTDWADFGYMLVFFFAGYLVYANPRLTAAIKRDGKLALVLGLGCTAVMVGALAAGFGRDWVEQPGRPGFYLAWTLAGINGWCWTMAVLALSMNLLQFRNKWLDTSQEGIVPFFLFHQPVIVFIAFYVVQWQAPVALKLPFILLTAYAGTILLYELFVRRVGPARALLGMKRPGSG